jgi:hypothetical protein
MVAAGRHLHCSEEQILQCLAEQPPDSDWTEGNSVDGLISLEVAQHRLFPADQIDQHGQYIV